MFDDFSGTAHFESSFKRHILKKKHSREFEHIKVSELKITK